MLFTYLYLGFAWDLRAERQTRGALVCVLGILAWLCCAEGKPGQMKELNMETRARNTAVTGQNPLETNCSKLTQAVILLSALQERAGISLFSPHPPSCPRKLKRAQSPLQGSSGQCVLEPLARRYNLLPHHSSWP